jgi:hypothetical protein
MKKFVYLLLILSLATPLTSFAQFGGFLKGLEDFAKGLEQFSKDLENVTSQNQGANSNENAQQNPSPTSSQQSSITPQSNENAQQNLSPTSSQQSNNTAQQSNANEVGNRTFVAEPKAAPVYVSKGGTRYWPCNGFVGQNVIDVTYAEIVQLSNNEGIKIPQKNFCYWKRGVFNFGGNSIQTYTIQFYLDQNAFYSCTTLDNCQEIRSMDFKMINDQLHRQYLITSAPNRKTRFACIANTGKVVSATSGC